MRLPAIHSRSLGDGRRQTNHQQKPNNYKWEDIPISGHGNVLDKTEESKIPDTSKTKPEIEISEQQ